MAEINVSITNGSGSSAMKAGLYSVSVVAAGYDESTLTPTSYTATASEGSGSFTVTATGTLTFNVNETGASGGTPVTAGSIVMTNSSGSVEYGSAVNIDSSGNAVFNNVPFGNATAPYTLYFKQLTSDDNHNIYTEIISVSMTSSSQSEYVINTPIATQSFTLTDGTYLNMPVASATLTLTSN